MRATTCRVVVLLCAVTVTGASAGQHVFTGLRLEEALRLLQQDGLAIVFSSETVTPDMRVGVEPKTTTPRRQLDELLAVHGLRAEDGPGMTILVVRAPTTAVKGRPPVIHHPRSERPPLGRAADPPVTLPSYVDRVSVFAASERGDGTPGAVVFDRSALQTASTPLDADGLSAVHAMPGVAVLDDSRSDFSVRGSPYRQVATIIDGVSTRWLQHAVYGHNGAGTLAMFGSDVLERLTLRAGAYPRTYDDTLGAQLEVTLREGSREATRVVGTAGPTSAAVIGEGPIAGGRGSCDRRRPQQLSRVAAATDVAERGRIRLYGCAREVGVRPFAHGAGGCHCACRSFRRGCAGRASRRSPLRRVQTTPPS